MLSRTMRRACRCHYVRMVWASPVALWRRCRRQHRTAGCVVSEYIDADVGVYHDQPIGGKPKADNKVSPSVTTTSGRLINEVSTKSGA
jgi:hypothetical protein